MTVSFEDVEHLFYHGGPGQLHAEGMGLVQHNPEKLGTE
jgi:hypothetical protein